MQDTELLSTENVIETDTELVDETGTESLDMENGTEIENPEAGEQSGAASGSDIEAAVYAAMESYFAENTILVSDAGDVPGIHKPIDEFSLTEVCLVIIVLILLGASIFKLIGERVWNKL